MKKLPILIILAILFLSSCDFSNDLQLELSFDKESVSLGEPLFLKINVTNKSDSILRIHRPNFSRTGHPVKIRLEKNGIELKGITMIVCGMGPSLSSIKPDESFETLVNPMSKYLDRINESGEYVVKVVYYPNREKKPIEQKISFWVKPFTTAELIEKKEAAPFILISSLGRGNKNVITSAKKFLEKYPNSKYSLMVKYSLVESLINEGIHEECFPILNQILNSSEFKKQESKLAYLRIANFYKKMENKEKAMDMYKKSKRLFSNSEEAFERWYMKK